MTARDLDVRLPSTIPIAPSSTHAGTAAHVSKLSMPTGPTLSLRRECKQWRAISLVDAFVPDPACGQVRAFSLTSDPGAGRAISPRVRARAMA
jgi:hypothetical protein